MKTARQEKGRRSKLLPFKPSVERQALRTSTKLRLLSVSHQQVSTPVWVWNLERDINSMKSIQVFVNKCLRNILGIRWPDTISNSNLWRKTIKQQPVETTIGTYRWNWLGHTLRKPNTNTTRQALEWNPQGHWKRGRPKNTWHRVLTSDLGKLGETRNLLQKTEEDGKPL